MHRCAILLALFMAIVAIGAVSLPALAQTTVEGSIAPAVQQFGSEENSSKLTEYRDFRDNFYLPDARFNVFERKNGWFFDFFGSNISRDDQTVAAEGGRLGVWKLWVDWADTPHNFSNKAQTPYIQRAAGRLEVPATIPITFKKLATVAADAPSVLAMDDVIAAYQADFLRPIELANKTRAGRVGVEYAGFENAKLALTYGLHTKSGFKSAFAPIGDRPPRTLNIQLTEPVNYRTQEVTARAELQTRGFDLQLEYLFSDFNDRIDTFEWQNAFATPGDPEATFDVWDRAVSVFGRRPLPPDNQFHQGSVAIAHDLPLDSRLSATLAFGRLQQNQTLLPYSFNSDLLVDPTLPRTTAEAEISTTQVLADYVIHPTARLNLRAWARFYGLDNNTPGLDNNPPASMFNYVTSDTSSLTGTVSYKNRRISLAYAQDRINAGVEGSYRVARRSTLSLAYEREEVQRDFREADTTEHRVTASFRTRPAKWANVRARYIFGDRNSENYDGLVTRQSYWYDVAQANDRDNPQFTFSNHPDTRRFDVSERRRHQFDLTASVTHRDKFSVSGTIRYRKDDFDSDVTPSQPLLDNPVPGTELDATSPGDQLGLLEGSNFTTSIDLFSMPHERMTLNAFVGWNRGRHLQRGLEFDENAKEDPSVVATATLGPWTRASSQWLADYEDRGWTFGAGATLVLIPKHLDLIANYTASLADVDITYSGYGVTNFDGTPFAPNFQFAFSTTPTINENLHVFDLRFEIPIWRTALVLGYTFEDYSLDDWQQNTALPWVEPVGSEFLLRDTSRSHQWGNRLFNLGSELAPDYRAHIGYVALKYRF